MFGGGFPFGAFPGMGDMPGGMGGGGRGKAASNNTRYYELLGVSKDATQGKCLMLYPVAAWACVLIEQCSAVRHAVKNLYCEIVATLDNCFHCLCLAR
jgi:hypothetical protein